MTADDAIAEQSDPATGSPRPPTRAERRAYMRARFARNPSFLAAVRADARAASAHRGVPLAGTSSGRLLLEAIRLAWSTDAFAALAMYRLRGHLLRLGIPVLPRILHRLSILTGQLAIGDPVNLRPGVNVAHGLVVIDGVSEVGSGTTISPFVTIGLIAGNVIGPTIGRDVHIGTGAKVIGPIAVGDGAWIGANAVVIDDVPIGATVVGVPAQVVRSRA